MMISFSYWWLIIPGMLLGLYAQFRVMSSYAKYSRVGSTGGISGAQAAREILDNAGLSGMPIEAIGGHLTDHYDPTKKALFLSGENYHGNSLAAVGVAAHEAGHALQHKAAYGPMQLRMMLVPATQFASYAWIGLLVVGMFLGSAVFSKFLFIAIAIFAVTTLFQIVTLPVEFDASRRAKEQLVRLGLVQGREIDGVTRVLNAAALTYVAAMITSVLHLLRFVLMARSQDRD